MSKNIFSEKIDYVNRFSKNQGKQLKFPSFIYNDVKLHPKHKDHIVVLSETKLPGTKNKDGGKNKKFNMKYCYDNNFLYSLAGMESDEKTADIFKEEVINAEEEVEEQKDAQPAKHLRVGGVKFKTASPAVETKKTSSPNLDNADKLIEETKGLGLAEDWSSDSDSYEGGQDDKKKSKEENKSDQDDDSSVEARSDEDGDKSSLADKTADQIEKEVDSILKDESEKNKDKSDNKNSGSDGEEEEKKSTLTKSTKSIAGKKKDSTINVDEEDDGLDGTGLIPKDDDEETKKDQTDANQEEDKDSEEKEELKDDRPTNDDHSEDDKKEEGKDEEEPESKPEEEKAPEATMNERFKKLPEEFQQRVLNNTLDRAQKKHPDKFKWNYHGYSPFPAGPNSSKQGYEAGKIANDRFAVKDHSADEMEKPKFESVTYSESDYLNFNQDAVYEGIPYEPEILRK